MRTSDVILRMHREGRLPAAMAEAVVLANRCQRRTAFGIRLAHAGMIVLVTAGSIWLFVGFAGFLAPTMYVAGGLALLGAGGIIQLPIGEGRLLYLLNDYRSLLFHLGREDMWFAQATHVQLCIVAEERLRELANECEKLLVRLRHDLDPEPVEDYLEAVNDFHQACTKFRNWTLLTKDLTYHKYISRAEEIA